MEWVSGNQGSTQNTSMLVVGRCGGGGGGRAGNGRDEKKASLFPSSS